MNDLQVQHSSLCSSPWHLIAVAGKKWIVKSAFSDHHYEILFSDFTNVWHEHLESGDVEHRLKEINPSLEIDMCNLLIYIHRCITARDGDSSYNIMLSSDLHLTFTVTSKLSGLPFCWKFYAAPVSLDMIRHHLTEPLVAMVSALNQQKSELITLLKSKDREISDLKAQGVNVSRKKLETVVFDETTFSQNAVQSENLHSCIQDAAFSAFSTGSQQLYSELSKVCGFCTVHSGEDTSTDGSLHNSESTAASSTSSPSKSPHKCNSDQTKEIEMQRRLALEKRLAEEEKKDALKKRKKIKF